MFSFVKVCTRAYGVRRNLEQCAKKRCRYAKKAVHVLQIGVLSAVIASDRRGTLYLNLTLGAGMIELVRNKQLTTGFLDAMNRGDSEKIACAYAEDERVAVEATSSGMHVSGKPCLG